MTFGSSVEDLMGLVQPWKIPLNEASISASFFITHDVQLCLCSRCDHMMVPTLTSWFALVLSTTSVIYGQNVLIVSTCYLCASTR